MPKIIIDSTELEKLAQLSYDTLPKLQELDILQTGMADFAKMAAVKLAKAELIRPGTEVAVEKDILEGGITKHAELVNFLVARTVKPVASMGNAHTKSAEAATTASPEDVFDSWVVSKTSV